MTISEKEHSRSPGAFSSGRARSTGSAERSSAARYSVILSSG
jgi:hypothetical protein